ncbi:MAG: mechanosensitive ion channel [Acidobacteriota bacterium]
MMTIAGRVLLLAVLIWCLPMTLAAQEPDPGATAGTSVSSAEVDNPTAPATAPDPAPTDPAATADQDPSVVGTVVGGAQRTASSSVGAVGEAVSETAGAVSGGLAEVASQGKAQWREVLMPMGQRFAAAFPSVVKAIALLLLFWLVALLAGAAVRKVLSLTDKDEKLARDWGLEGFLKRSDGSERKVDDIAGTVVKWIILLFGFVAFFNALDLELVASPLQNVLNTVTGAVPSLLKAAVILLAYWAIGSVVKLAATKGLGALGFDQRAGRFLPPREIKGETVGPSALVGRLLFYIILLLGILPFLQALGQESLVAPLRDMMAKVLGFIPNIVAALILLFVGKIIATVVREIVTNFLAATGIDGVAERFGFGQGEKTKKVSEIAGAVAFFFIIIPILVAAVDSLKVQAISDPVKSTLEQLMAAIPLIFVALVVIAVGYYIARAVRGFVESFLSGVGFDGLPKRLGLSFLEPRDGAMSLSAIGGTVVMAVILLLTAEQALATLGLHQLSDLVGGLLAFLPSLGIGLAVILAALSLGHYVSELLGRVLASSAHRAIVQAVAKWAIVFLGFSMGLNQLGVGQEIIVIAVSAVLGGAALALGLAFGLGGREKAREIIDRGNL